MAKEDCTLVLLTSGFGKERPSVVPGTGCSGVGVGGGAGEMVPGTSRSEGEEGEGRLGFGFSCEVWLDP